MSRVTRLIPILLLFLALPACRLIDEDLADCDRDLSMDYELRLATNITTQLETELSLETEVSVATSLKSYLNDVFTDRAHDVNLSFYDVVGDSTRLHHEQHIMDANQTSYTLNIPVHRYMHLGLANLEENSGILSLQNDGTCHGSRLQQLQADTLSPHRQGVFSARLSMDVLEGIDQEFKVNLFMANCSAVLLLDTLGSHVKDIRVFASGFATAFDVADSLFRFQYPQTFRADKVEVKEPGSPLCFTTVNFPSRMPETTKAEEDEPALWEFRVYATLPGGSVTESILSVSEPLLAAHLEILKAKVDSSGALETDNKTVGVSVTLDWTPGMEHEVIL